MQVTHLWSNVIRCAAESFRSVTIENPFFTHAEVSDLEESFYYHFPTWSCKGHKHEQEHTAELDFWRKGIQGVK